MLIIGYEQINNVTPKLMIEAEQVTTSSPELNQLMEEMGHEQVVFCQDKNCGLQAIIAIHDTTLGPGMGGTRIWNYAKYTDAVKDVLRLSRGMTYKNSIAGLNIGGGKAVIIGDPRKKSEAMLRRFGRFIESLGGRYVTAEDVGMGPSDMEYIAMETRYVTGLPETMGGSGNPSPVTAYGVYMGMKAAAKKAYGSDSLEKLHVWVQGVGNVGYQLVKLLSEEGCQISISDVYDDQLAKTSGDFKVNVLPANQDLSLAMDIYAPCALGATLTTNSISKLRCGIIAGGANNQLEDENIHAAMLQDNGILYAPDFLINSGGIINVYLEYMGIHDQQLALNKTESIYDTCISIYEKSHKEGVTTHQAALEMAKERIEAIGKLKHSF